MLVVADEPAGGVGRKGGLAGARQAEENRRAARLRVDVGGAVHGQHVVLNGEQVVHRGEDRLLDLARVAGTCDDDDAALKVDGYDRLGGGAVGLGVAAVVGGGKHHEIGLVGLKLLGSRPHEHLAGEEGLVGLFAHHGEVARMGAVGAGHATHDIRVTLGKIGTNALVDAVEVLGCHGGVDLAPRDAVVHVGRVDDETVLRGTARVLTRGHRDGAGARKGALVALDGCLDEVGGSHVHMHERRFRPLKAKLGDESRVGASSLACACRAGRLGHRRYRLSFWQNIPLEFHTL